MSTAPSDLYDETWLAHVRPPAYRNPAPQGRYNLLVIGAGTAGLVAATGAAALGARVAIVEQNFLGGAHLAAVLPRLAFVRSARALAEARRAREFGVRMESEPTPDFPAAMRRARQIRAERAACDNVTQLTAKGVDVFFGEAQFVDGAHVAVDGQVLEFARALVATGSAPTPPPIPGVETVRALRPAEIFLLNVPPPRLAIFGAGSAACEFAQAFARFGSQVTIYETGPRILPEEDSHPAVMVQQALERDGVIVRAGCVEARIAESRISGYMLGGEFADEFDEVLFLSGRKPNIAGLNLEAAHVETTEQGIVVNDRLRTTNPRIYAAGDVCARFSFLHASDALARSVVANALFFGTYKFSSQHIPALTLTDPPIAHIGSGERDEHVQSYQVMDLTFKDVDRALLDDETGFLRIYHDRRGTIHGATLVATHADEMIGELALAMRHNIRLSALAADLHPYPSLAEIYRRAGDTYRRTLLTPTVAKFLKKLLKWRR